MLKFPFIPKQVLLMILMAFILSGCGNDILFQEEKPVNRDGWSYDEVLNYSFEANDTLTKYNLYLDIQHDHSFSYQNLYLKVITNFPKSNPVEQQLSIELMDKFGSWNGTCKGNECNRKVILKEDFVFSETGPYKIEINQWSRESTLAGIVSIGLYVQKSAT